MGAAIFKMLNLSRMQGADELHLLFRAVNALLLKRKEGHAQPVSRSDYPQQSHQQASGVATFTCTAVHSLSRRTAVFLLLHWLCAPLSQGIISILDDCAPHNLCPLLMFSIMAGRSVSLT